MMEGGIAIQRDLDSLEKWAARNLTKFNKGILHLGRNSSIHQCMLMATQVQSSFEGKDLGGPRGHQVDHEPAMSIGSKEG